MPMPKGTKITNNDTRLNIYIPKGVKGWLKKYSERRRESMNNIIVRLLEQERQQIDDMYGADECTEPEKEGTK
jgi:hypothetical protein